MLHILEYVRRLIGWKEDETVLRKRDRDNRDLEDDRPAVKRFKGGIPVIKSKYPGSAMASKEDGMGFWRSDRTKTNPNVRYIELRSSDCDFQGPSTSTPFSNPKFVTRKENIPNTSNIFDRRFSNEFKDGLEMDSPKCNEYSELQLSPNIETHEFIPRVSPKSNIKCVNLDDKDNWLVDNNTLHKRRIFIEQPFDPRISEVLEIGDDVDDDIIYVNECDLKQNGIDEFRRKLKSPTMDAKPTVLRMLPVEIETKRHNSRLQNIRNVSSGDSNSIHGSSRHGRSSTNETFKTPHGITKSKYSHNLSHIVARSPNTRPLRKQNSDTLLYSRSNSQNAISNLFNLEEKKDYMELIKRMSGKTKTSCNVTTPFSKSKSYSKKFDYIDLTKSSISKLMNGTNDINGDKEYDPVTIASINSSDSEVEIIGSTDDLSSTSQKPIHRVNSLKEKFEEKIVSKSDWLTDLEDRYKSITLDRKKELQEADHKATLISTINLENYNSTLKQKLKSVLTFQEIVVEEDSEEVPLPELTIEQQKMISYILSVTANPNEVIIEKFRYSLKRRDLLTLDGLNWLNDEVINFYINLIMQRGQERKDLPKVFGINTFFYPKLLSTGQAGLKRWTRNVDIFEHDFMIVPVHLDVHWCMSIIDFRERTIKYYDSMGGVNINCLNALLKYLEDEHMEKKKKPLDSKQWKKECVKNIPQQMNGSDCGMFACTFAEYVCRNARINFTQKDMPYFRRKMVIEIKHGKLLL